MRSYLIPIGLIAALGACNVSDAKEGTPVASSGTGGTRSFAATGFEKVSLRGPDNVVVRVGPAVSVVATGPSDVLDKLEIEVVDGGLRVGRKRESGIGWSDNGKGATITVTLPRLVAASVAGSGDMTVDRAEAPSFDISVAGSGSLRLDALQSDAAAINLAGSGDAIVGGSAKSLDVAVAGSGDVDAAGFKSEHASIKVAGSGNVKAGVDGDADVSILGSGDVEIVGKAKCTISKLGSGGRDLHRLTIALLIAAMSVPAAAADRTIGITSFDRIKVEGPYIVTVSTGKPVSAKASGDRDAAERVSLRVEGRMLVVSTDRTAWGGWPGSKAGAATVKLTTPVLTSAFLVGSGSLGIDAMKSAKITLIVDGSGRMTVGSAAADRIDVSASGSGSVVVAGVAKDAGLAVRGTAELDASRLQTSDLVVTSESAGAVTAQAKRSAKVTAVGAGTVDVKGAAACTVRQLSAGPVTCGK